jgi:hypothetical protein
MFKKINKNQNRILEFSKKLFSKNNDNVSSIKNPINDNETDLHQSSNKKIDILKKYFINENENNTK